MKRNKTNIFIFISNLMLLLHILRGDLIFMVSGWIPYALYYGTMVFYVVGLLYRLRGVIMKKEKS